MQLDESSAQEFLDRSVAPLIPQIQFCSFKLKNQMRKSRKPTVTVGRPILGSQKRQLSSGPRVHQGCCQTCKNTGPLAIDNLLSFNDIQKGIMDEVTNIKERKNRNKFLRTILSKFKVKHVRKQLQNTDSLGLQIRKMTISERKKQQLEKKEEQLQKQSSIEDIAEQLQSVKEMRSTSYGQQRNYNKCRMKTYIQKLKQRQKIQKEKEKNIFKFGAIQEGTHKVYQAKLKSYRQFVMMMNFAHSFCADLKLLHQISQDRSFQKLKVYIGRGNNSNLVISLLKRRFWWQIVDNIHQANFVWTQLKVNEIYTNQKKIAQAMLQQFSKEQSSTRCTQDIQVKPRNRQHSLSRSGKLKQDTLLKKIFTQSDIKLYGDGFQQLKDFQQRLRRLGLKKNLHQGSTSPTIHNHFQKNYYLGNKKAMFYTLKEYFTRIGKNPFTIIPLTFHIQKGLNDRQYKRFSHFFKRRASQLKKNEDERGKNIWIVKPGENTNRGNGITVIDQLYQLNRILSNKQKHANGKLKTYIVQQYLDRPLLYNKRKFDIRHYLVITRLHGLMRAYWSFDGYIRTSSQQYNCQDLDIMTHLTNDAVQKNGDSYGRYETANKISYQQFQRYLDSKHPKKEWNFQKDVYPKMKEIGRDAVKANFHRLDPDRLQNNFQIFGLDFMIDCSFKPWLIEINTNPCLQIPCPLLQRIIPTMLEHSFRVSIDVLFPPPCHYPNSQKHLVPDNILNNLRLELIFDQSQESERVQSVIKEEQMGQISEQEQQYTDQGVQITDDVMM